MQPLADYAGCDPITQEHSAHTDFCAGLFQTQWEVSITERGARNPPQSHAVDGGIGSNSVFRVSGSGSPD